LQRFFAHREEHPSSGASRRPGSSPGQALLPAQRGEGRSRGKRIGTGVVFLGSVGNVCSGPKARLMNGCGGNGMQTLPEQRAILAICFPCANSPSRDSPQCSIPKMEEKTASCTRCFLPRPIPISLIRKWKKWGDLGPGATLHEYEPALRITGLPAY
jgi:hypothetical protein